MFISYLCQLVMLEMEFIEEHVIIDMYVFIIIKSNFQYVHIIILTSELEHMFGA